MFISRENLGLGNDFENISGINCDISISVEALDTNQRVISGNTTFPVTVEILNSMKENIFSYIRENIDDFLAGENLKVDDDM